MMYLQLIGGFVLLLAAAEIMIRGAVALARRFGVSPMIIGMTVIALGTSAPEFVVSLDAALIGSGGLAVGNLVGSNIANVLLILGASYLIKPMTRKPDSPMQDSIMLIAFTGIFIALGWNGDLDFVDGCVLFLLFVGFLGGVYWRGLNDPKASRERIDEVEEFGGLPDNLMIFLLATGGGIAGIVLGADLLVKGGVGIAREFGVPEEVIGLTLIAIGTSLPELAASIVAALRAHADVALGNVIGSNVFNLTGVGGLVVLIVPLPVSEAIRTHDVWVMMGATLALIPLMMGWIKLGRVGGALFLIAYFVFIGGQADQVLG